MIQRLMSKITPHNLWLIHRLSLNGRSAITGQALPDTIDDCPEGVQASHYAMAVATAAAYGDPDVVPIPGKLTPERAFEVREQAQRQGRSMAGLATAFARIAPTS